MVFLTLTKRTIFYTGILLLISGYTAHSQSLTGTSGLFTIPTANIYEDGEVSLGVNYLPQKYNQTRFGTSDAMVYSGSVAFLPFLELNIRLTKPNDSDPDYIGDRMPSFRVKFYSETEFVPSIAVGVHDFLNTPDGSSSDRDYNSIYAVVSKNFSTKTIFHNLEFTLGYGSDAMDAAGYQFIGLFGGVSASVNDWFEILLEYDADRMNSGIRIKWWHFRVLAGFMGNKDFTGGIAFNFVM